MESGRTGRDLGTGTPKLRKAGVEVNLETGGSPGRLPDRTFQAPPQGISTFSSECPASFSEGEGRGRLEWPFLGSMDCIITHSGSARG